MDSQAADVASKAKQAKERADPLTPIQPRVYETESSDEDDEDENARDGAIRASPRGRKRKSILQPKGSKFSKKAAGRRNSSRVAEVQDNDEVDEDEILEDASPLATAASNRNKRQPRTEDDAPNESYHEYLPKPYIEVKLVRYDLPTTIPQGPGDTWSCEFEGCVKMVYKGSTEEGKEKIKAHFREHEAAAQEKIDLVMNERRPYLPVE